MSGIPMIDQDGRTVGEITGHSVSTEHGRPYALILVGVLHSTGRPWTSAIRIEPGVPPFILDTTARTPDPTPPTESRG